MPKKPNQGPCSAISCGRPIEVHQWCGKHYRMQRLHGRTELKYKGQFSHPLYRQWWERHDRQTLCAEWQDDFWAFAAAIGNRPSQSHVLQQINRDQPYGPNNWRWIEPLRKEKAETIKEFHARKWQSRREKHPEYERRRHLIRNFGLTPDQYEKMLSDQQGVCAICKQPETGKHQKGSTKSLAVDHDHESGLVRDLLCWRCNGTIGRVEESVEILRAMIAYLEMWKADDHPGINRPAPELANPHEIMLTTQWGVMNASDAARKVGLLPATVLGRLRNGWAPDAALQPLKRVRRLLKRDDPGDVL